MKTLFTVMLMVVAVATTSFAQDKSASDEVAIAKARAEVQSTCLAGSGDVSSSVWQSPYDGNFYVYFYNTFKCQPNTICPLYLRIGPLARVTLNSDFNVISSQCGFWYYELK
ncbi:hypothetical protein JYU23_00255 [bacterium AH-315-C07]|nr:hypothetical protein [bacterium AH-315-C07]